MAKPLSLMTDAELVAELASYGHDAAPPTNGHLPVTERRALAATEPPGENGLCREAEDRLALRTKLQAIRRQR